MNNQKQKLPLSRLAKIRKDRQARWRKRWNLFSVYLIVFLGVVASQAIPDIKEPVFVLPSLQEALSSILVGVLALWLDERSGDELGKIKNFGRRAKGAFLLGYFAFDFLEKIV